MALAESDSAATIWAMAWMKKCAVAVVIVCSVSLVSCVTSEQEVPPNVSAAHETEVNNLEDCWRVLDQELSSEVQKQIRDSKDPIEFHLSVGMWIRNRFGLWQNTPIAIYLATLQHERLVARHPGLSDQFSLEVASVFADESSQVILRSYQEHLLDPEITEEGFWSGQMPDDE